jgi:hypothetical protein
MALEAEAGHRLALSVGGQAAVADDLHTDAFLRHWLLPGGTVELSALPGAMALSAGFALACGARERAIALGKPRWIGAVDASATLCAPALAHILRPTSPGMSASSSSAPATSPAALTKTPSALSETLVVRPGADVKDVLACALRLVQSGACCAVVVDLQGAHDLGDAVIPMRRLSLAAEGGDCAVVVVTSARARRALPLTVAARALVDVDVGDVNSGDDVDNSGGHVVIRPVRHRHGLPPRLRLPRQRLSQSVVDDQVIALQASLEEEEVILQLQLVSGSTPCDSDDDDDSAVVTTQ